MSSIFPAPVAGPAANEPLPQNLEQACRAIEKQFALMVFSEMRKAMVPTAEKGSSGFATETTMSLLDSQWAELASQGEGLGLWRAMLRQLDPEAVKSAGGGVDQRSKDADTRKEADHDSTRGAGAPGLRLGRARALEAQAAYTGVSGLSGPVGRPRVLAPAEDREGM